MIPVISYAWIVRILNYIIPVKKKFWVFGADYGRSYKEGSKYMLEYMIKNHPDYECYFITRNPKVKDELDNKNIPCLLNFSLKGIWAISRAEAIFACQSFGDIIFSYKKKNRKFFYLIHGQPYKKAFKALSEEYIDKFFTPDKLLFDRIRNRIGKYFITGASTYDTAFVSASSDFLVPYIQAYFGKEIPVKILEMPRIDALYQPERFANEKWIDGLDNKMIITFMPTHRNYGKGELSPIPFKNNLIIQQWMRDNNIVLLIKQHPNMIPMLKEEETNDVLIDITKKGIDPMTCVYKSDVLMTDHSSVWMDFLIMKRPLIFYRYDNFEVDDGGILYNIENDFKNEFCYNEKELFERIKFIRNNYEKSKPSDYIVNKYHKYTDGNSCRRYFEEIVNNFLS